jgi:hypothetical protein
MRALSIFELPKLGLPSFSIARQGAGTAYGVFTPGRGASLAREAIKWGLMAYLSGLRRSQNRILGGHCG